jgi:hypothetical protein
LSRFHFSVIRIRCGSTFVFFTAEQQFFLARDLRFGLAIGILTTLPLSSAPDGFCAQPWADCVAIAKIGEFGFLLRISDFGDREISLHGGLENRSLNFPAPHIR